MEDRCISDALRALDEWITAERGWRNPYLSELERHRAKGVAETEVLRLISSGASVDAAFEAGTVAFVREVGLSGPLSFVREKEVPEWSPHLSADAR